jgi:hypothetical protein
MPRGYVWATYFDDNEEAWALQVNAEYVGMQERGWQTANVQLVHPMPRGWLPRKVFGYDVDGNRCWAVIPDVASLLWTGASSSFAIITNDGAVAIVTVAGRVSERRRVPVQETALVQRGADLVVRTVPAGRGRVTVYRRKFVPSRVIPP